LQEAATGNVVWVDEFSYEGLDLTMAQQAVVSFLTQSMLRILPNASRKSPVSKKG